MEFMDEGDDWNLTQDVFPEQQQPVPMAMDDGAQAAEEEEDVGESEEEEEEEETTATTAAARDSPSPASGSEAGGGAATAAAAAGGGKRGLGDGDGLEEEGDAMAQQEQQGAQAAAAPSQGKDEEGGGLAPRRVRKKSRASLDGGSVAGHMATALTLSGHLSPPPTAAAAGGGAGGSKAVPTPATSISGSGLGLSLSGSGSSSKGGGARRRKTPRKFDCTLYGAIHMDGLCLEIIDTPQFQRLGYISQLGACPLVYRGATHTRLQHSLGVAHLAETFVRTLVKNQPDLLRGQVLPKDILCVKVAGLCHDLGHGPFSHAFEYLVERIAAGTKDPAARAYLGSWRHEDMSLRLLDALIQENGIKLDLYGLNAQDLTFIKECIAGTPPGKRQGGREGLRSFLYDVVNNARSGLDVDKLDYFKRDARNCAVDITPGWERMMEEARVALAEGLEGHDAEPQSWQIVFKKQHIGSALTWFSTRFRLHTHVYQNKVVKEVELMLSDILIKAEPHLRIPGRRDPQTGEVFPTDLFRISETLDAARAGSLKAYCNLTDSLLDRIMTDLDPKLQPSRRLIQRLRRRDLYTSVGTVNATPQFLRDKYPHWDKARGAHELTEQIHHEIFARAQALVAAASSNHHSQSQSSASASSQSIIPLPPLEEPPLALPASEDLLHVELTVVHYGKGERNPVKFMRFLDSSHGSSGSGSGSSGNGQRGLARQVRDDQLDPCLLPTSFQTRKIRVFCKDRAFKEIVHRAFAEWCAAKKHEPLEECEGEEEDGNDDDGDDHHDV